jgi:RNA polymerase subunit RPABC4/transcription elongation factor Spt4
MGGFFYSLVRASTTKKMGGCMALIKCKECGKEFSTDAKACPNCGKRRTTMTTKLFIVFVGLIVVMSVINSQRGQESKDTEATRRAALTPAQREAEDAKKAKDQNISAARYICRIALEKSLNDPDSAKLESSSSWYASERKDGTILVQPSGRAKNAFGAYINGVWDCVAKPEGSNIRVISLKQIRP